jgi:outer membrane protein assembly factor BamE (lipoprotein component of BamABCDE complex)
MDRIRMTTNVGLSVRRITAAVLLVGLASCQAAIETRGFVPDDDSIGQIRVGLQKRDDVQALLGTPSSVMTFGDETWLYINRKTRTVAFFEPTILEQKVVAVVFGGDGLVSDIRRLELADGKLVQHVGRVTPTPGKELSFVEQLLGNIGKFNNTRQVAGNQRLPPGY